MMRVVLYTQNSNVQWINGCHHLFCCDLDSALNILCHNEVTIMDVLAAFPEELSFIKEDEALCRRLEIEGTCKTL